MQQELNAEQFGRITPLFESYLREPLLWAVLEGRREGRVWVNDAIHPTAALVWSGTECLYAAGGEGDPAWHRTLHETVLAEIVPPVRESGGDFCSLFCFPNAYADVLEGVFRGQIPLRTPVETFCFDRERFVEQHERFALQDGLTLVEMDKVLLRDAQNAFLAQEIEGYWGSIEAFLDQSYGYAILDGNQVLSTSYSEAYGAGTRAMTVLTHPEHRRKGLARTVCTALIDRCLAEGDEPYWMCDQGNAGSRRLAERLGFAYTGDLWLLDIPFVPSDFYQGLAASFYMPNRMYSKAVEAYERAFSAGEGQAEDYYNAAIASAYAGNEDQAFAHLRTAIRLGGIEEGALQTEEAFLSQHRTEVWSDLIALWSDQRRSN